MYLKILPFILSLCILLCSCGSGNSNKDSAAQPIPFKIISQSALCKTQDFILTLDSADHTLRLKLHINRPKNFPFPINKKYKDTLSKTAFHFDFYFNGLPIRSDYKKIK